MFGQGEHPVDAPEPGPCIYWGDNGFDDEEIWRLFFGTLAPWEYNEFGCLWRYCYDRTKDPYAEIRSDLKAYGPNNITELPARLQETVLPSSSLLDTDDLNMSYDIRENLVSFSPTFLCRFPQEREFHDSV
ncbi:hypothetical protein BDV19DRAFT_386872 [Aspergillus venezuelensis]